MKSLQTNRNEAGSVLLLSLIVTAILGLTLASYMLMAQQQNKSVMRSQTWNSAIVMSEAGVEDALALLNKYNSQFDTLTNWATSSSIAADNWSNLGSGIYYVRRYIGDNYYDVYITNANTQTPAISSVGYSKWYLSQNSPSAYYAAVGSVNSTGPTMLSRKVNVSTKIDSLINVAMAAIQQIDFNGKNVETDSFDSTDTAYSDWPAGSPYGVYPISNPAKQKANGDVVTDYTIINSLNAGNAKIKGQAKTGPTGTLYLGPNGSVGDKAWVESGTTGVQPGHFADDMNVLFPSVQLPSTTWFYNYTGNTVIDGITYDVVINNSGDYYVNTFSRGIYVRSNAVVRLLITGSVNMNGSADTIRVCKGAILKLYMYGPTFKIAGNGVVNDNEWAGAFYYFGLPSNSSVQFNGNAAFTGVIYAPQAAFTLGGGGNNTYDFIGASVSRTVKMNGHYHFHYDEALKKNGLGRGYIPTSWKES